MDVTDAQDAELEIEQGDDDERERFASVQDALRVRRIPLENHPVVLQIVERIGIREFVNTSSYVKAMPEEAGRKHLQISYGYTNGFASAAEAAEIVASLKPESLSSLEVYKSSRKGTWGIVHPVNAIRDGSGRRDKQRKDWGTCPECFMKFSAAGTCGCA